MRADLQFSIYTALIMIAMYHSCCYVLKFLCNLPRGMRVGSQRRYKLRSLNGRKRFDDIIQQSNEIDERQKQCMFFKPRGGI